MSYSLNVNDYISRETSDYMNLESYQTQTSFGLESTYLGGFSEIMAENPKYEAVGLYDQLHAYTERNISDWSGEDCFDWAFTVNKQNSLQCSSQDQDCHLNAFKLTSGKELLEYTENDFKHLVDTYRGGFFFRKFQELVQHRNKSCRINVEELSYTKLENMNANYNDNYLSVDNYSYSDYRSNILDDSFESRSDEISDLNLNCTQEELLSTSREYSPIVFNQNSNSLGIGNELEQLNIDAIEFKDLLDCNSMAKSPISESNETEGEYEGAAGFQGYSSSPSKTENFSSPHWFEKLPASGQRKKRARGPICWEFLLRLLQDSRTNPTWIRWEDYHNGVFRLMKPHDIAALWGSRTNKPLKYENFSRLLRHHYKKSMNLQPVQEQQMVYKFGSKVLEDIKKGKKW